MKENASSFYKHLLVDLLPLVLRKRRISKSVLILRMDSIGDYILFRNFLRVVKESGRFRDYTITLCGNEQWKELAEKLDGRYVDRFIWLSRYSFWHNPVYRIKKLLEINRTGYEVVLNPCYTREPLYTDSAAHAAAAREKTGIDGETIFDLVWQKKITDKWYTSLVKIDDAIVFEFEKTKKFFESVLKEKIGLQRPFIDLEAESGRKYSDGRYAVICPGGRNALRKWSADNYIAIADYLHGRYDMGSVFVGSKEDKLSSEQLKKVSDRQYIANLIGELGLVQTAECVRKSELVVSNDTSVAHIGLASGKKVVVISNGNHYGRFTECPVSVYDKIRYIYSPGVIESAASFGERVKLFSRVSDIDINLTDVQSVMKVVDEICS
jgi:ADP-heptose:LPS heptosyltransferase